MFLISSVRLWRAQQLFLVSQKHYPVCHPGLLLQEPAEVLPRHPCLWRDVFVWGLTRCQNGLDGGRSEAKLTSRTSILVTEEAWSCWEDFMSTSNDKPVALLPWPTGLSCWAFTFPHCPIVPLPLSAKGYCFGPTSWVLLTAIFLLHHHSPLMLL